MRPSLRSGVEAPAYEGRHKVCTPTELSFLHALEAALGDQYRVLSKVRLADIISIRNDLSSTDRMYAFNRIKSKHVDFVICHRHSLRILCVVELDDKTHGITNRKKRDRFVDAALQQAGIPVSRFTASALSSSPNIRNQ